MMKWLLPYALLLLMPLQLFSQVEIHLTRKKLFRDKEIIVPLYSKIYYKPRLFSVYRSGEIAGASESVLVLKSGAIIRWDDCHDIRIQRANFLHRKFRRFFVRLGLLFFPLNTLNQVITDNRPVISPLAAMISAGLLGTGFLLWKTEFRHLKGGKKLKVRIVQRNYEELGSPAH